MSARDFRKGSAAGFTLVEILLALALTALVLVAMNTFIFSMGELWGRNNESRLFDQHVRNVTRFLESELRSAALPPVGKANNAAIAPQDVRTQSGSTDPLLTYQLPAGSRLMNWPDKPLPDVVCSLAYRDRVGLVLLYHSQIEKKFLQDPPRETVITPLVSGLSYDYFDPDFKHWKTTTTFDKDNNGQYKIPQRIRLKFTYGKMPSRESIVVLPVPVEGLPLF